MDRARPESIGQLLGEELTLPEKISDPEQALLFLLRHPLRRELLRLYVKEDGSLSPKQLSDFTKKHLSMVGSTSASWRSTARSSLWGRALGAGRWSTSTKRRR